jgi:Zn-dependent M28 family amino/carboxypeptidase
VSVVLELARLFATRQTEANLVFVAFAGEEQGLFGSAHFAQMAADQHWNVEADLNMDIVGATLGGNDATDLNVALRFRRDRFLRSSDHVSFLAHQIRRLRVPVPRGPHGRLHGRGAGPLARAAYERAGDLGDPDLRHRAALEHQPGAGRRRL